MMELVYFRMFKLINFLCNQFHKVKRIEALLYKRMKFRKSEFLEVSLASQEKDA